MFLVILALLFCVPLGVVSNRVLQVIPSFGGGDDLWSLVDCVNEVVDLLGICGVFQYGGVEFPHVADSLSGVRL